ncbi:hypothetical protein chiPu_0020835, partial [Chiloscyllium punctatum]|nr:hypothetical protein [Chiloscyllium punctatum]
MFQNCCIPKSRSQVTTILKMNDENNHSKRKQDYARENAAFELEASTLLTLHEEVSSKRPDDPKPKTHAGKRNSKFLSKVSESASRAKSAYKAHLTVIKYVILAILLA